jgi:hypothetical protein
LTGHLDAHEWLLASDARRTIRAAAAAREIMRQRDRSCNGGSGLGGPTA